MVFGKPRPLLVLQTVLVRIQREVLLLRADFREGDDRGRKRHINIWHINIGGGQTCNN